MHKWLRGYNYHIHWPGHIHPGNYNLGNYRLDNSELQSN